MQPCIFRKGNDPVQYFLVSFSVSDNTVFSDLFPARLKLRFDQRIEFSLFGPMTEEPPE